MKRTPEPELMDEATQARAYSEADFAAPHEAFCDAAQRVYSSDMQGEVLDLGCGPADVTVRFARRNPNCRIVGVDGAQAMLDLGQARIDKEGLSQRIKLAQHYLPSTTLPKAFDGVISNSLLHHLADPMVLWQTIATHVQKDAPVFVMDLMRPTNEAEVKQLVSQYASQEPEVLRHDFECSLHAAYRVDELTAQLKAAQLCHLTVEAITDRHLIVFGYR